MLGSRWLPSAPASWGAGDASASGARQRWASSAVKCRKERAAIAPIGFGPRARTSSARTPTQIRRARPSDRPAAAYCRRALGSAPGRLSVDPTRTRAIGGAGLALKRPSTRATVSTDRPDGSAHQRLLALERANRVRLTRATLKRRLRTGEVAAADAILRSSRDTDTMTVAELLLSQRGWGPARSAKMLRSVSLSEKKTLGSLTERQRVMLAAVLSSRS